ncbi:MAG: hypothetical protein CSA94_00615 [Bacteroidetes bacterium]|nr:MAG: hypothetical protein CSA94_00615 [Bacteroidota bacterium]
MILMKRLAFLFLLSFFIVAAKAQQLELQQKTIVCNSSYVELDAGNGFDTYQWSTGETTQVISVNTNGTYTVTVTLNGVEQTDATIVEFIYFTPSFTTNDTTLCYDNRAEFIIAHDENPDYQITWLPNNYVGDTLVFYPTEPEDYTVIIEGEQGSCSTTISTTLYPQIFAEVTQVNEICYGSCNGQMIANVSGGKKPYEYLWNQYQVPWDSIATDLCPGENELLIRDANKCRLITKFDVIANPAASADIITSPSDTIYYQNPVLNFDFENTSDEEITAWSWEFSNDTVTYKDRGFYYTFETLKENGTESAYNVTLEISNQFGCDTTIVKELPIVEAELFIPNVLTPNGDGVNDVFQIKNKQTDTFISNEFRSVQLFVYDRSGKVMVKSSNYQNDWKPEGIPDGTYFYVLKTIGYFKTDVYQGVITILGSEN